MKKLAITGLSANERCKLIERAQHDIKAVKDQELVTEAITFMNDIIEKFKGSNISLAKIKEMLGLELNKLEKN